MNVLYHRSTGMGQADDVVSAVNRLYKYIGYNRL